VSAAVSLAQVQAYAGDLVNALSAAAQTYLTLPSVTATDKVLVTTIVADLQQANTAIAAVVNVTNAQSIALQIVAFATQLEPLVLPFLGAAAPFVPVAMALLQAFIQSLPAPPATPVTPPVQLHSMALKYRG
jgi:hypothetical protein